MKRKELKNLAKKIAKAEMIIQTSTDKKEILRAQDEIMELSGKIDNVADMVELDDLVQEIISEIS